MSKVNERVLLEYVLEMETPNEIQEYASQRLEKVIEQEKRKEERALERAKEDAPLLAGVMEFLGNQDEPVKASEIASDLGISTSKVIALVKAPIANGTIIKTDNGKSKPATYSVERDETTDDE